MSPSSRHSFLSLLLFITAITTRRRSCSPHLAARRAGRLWHLPRPRGSKGKGRNGRWHALLHGARNVPRCTKAHSKNCHAMKKNEEPTLLPLVLLSHLCHPGQSYNAMCDIFSAGCVIHELSTLQRTFQVWYSPPFCSALPSVPIQAHDPLPRPQTLAQSCTASPAESTSPWTTPPTAKSCAPSSRRCCPWSLMCVWPS